MSKIRIIKEDGLFFPQKRNVFGWSYYYQASYPQPDGLEMPERVCFNTKQEALDFFEPSASKVVWSGELL